MTIIILKWRTETRVVGLSNIIFTIIYFRVESPTPYLKHKAASLAFSVQRRCKLSEM